MSVKARESRERDPRLGVDPHRGVPRTFEERLDFAEYNVESGADEIN